MYQAFTPKLKSYSQQKDMSLLCHNALHFQKDQQAPGGVQQMNFTLSK
jgi:hypothetical protein